MLNCNQRYSFDFNDHLRTWHLLDSDRRPRWRPVSVRVKLIPRRIHARVMRINVGEEHRCINDTFESVLVTGGMFDDSLDVAKSGHSLLPDVEVQSPVFIFFDAGECAVWAPASRTGYIESAKLGGEGEAAVRIVGEAWVTGRDNDRVTVD